MSTSRRNCCAALFWLKVTLAATLAFSGLGYEALLVYYRREWALGNPDIWVPPPPKPVIAANLHSSVCWHNGSVTDVSKAKLVPSNLNNGEILFGFSLNWQIDRPAWLAGNLTANTQPVIYNTFFSLSNTFFDNNTLHWQAQLAQEQHAMLEVTVFPWDYVLDYNGTKGTFVIEDISDQMLSDVAYAFAYINKMYGVPVLLRYGHEMNGNWLPPYAMRPKQYKASFRKLAGYIHNLTNMTAMLWSPNIYSGYPHNGSPIINQTAGLNDVTSENFRQLDTNHDGLLTELDDPYLPYYPDYDIFTGQNLSTTVDWVGLSIYNKNTNSTTNQAVIYNPDYLSNMIMGNDPIYPTQGNLNFYTRFSEKFNKPFILSETGAPYSTNLVGTAVNDQIHEDAADEVPVKSNWWNMIFDLANSGKFPNFKAAIWFEEKKSEGSNFNYGDNFHTENDYLIVGKPNVQAAFLADVKANPQVLFSTGQSNFTCDGSVLVQ
ncbi:glycoside hydrolase superfamily [Blyttiomyces helicus]|uniref:Glycoside hydrolase superfamily n=1 Tax=Blyttiomyces helicus TaxID=388810 RepID=A0A4V1ISK4_9FUNG|nr:glycoside hydrolase superfamily [Blyttiomyces helicus]|eukprot:RKO93867.1 glycoside hydrolase superfamily [Blyttiomyces helicus]